jgi:hypothetical protein
VRLRAFYGAHIRHHLPPMMQQFVHRVVRQYGLWLLTPLPTRMRGPRWRRSRDKVEVDITYLCDLGCFNCDRSCSQDPTSDHMSVGQIRQFLEESMGRQIRWKRIGLLGGEPTCHPHFLEVVDLVCQYRDEFSPETQISVATNGHSEQAMKLISQLPASVRVKNSAKTTREQPLFHTFNVAAVDVRDYRKVDFSNACPVTQKCGIGVTPYGYYPCAAAGAIDRTFGFDLGRKVLPQDRDDMKQELRALCALCGHFGAYNIESALTGPLEGPVMSRTWAEAYERSRENPARLSRLAERADSSESVSDRHAAHGPR